jgi:hypothetical protein
MDKRDATSTQATTSTPPAPAEMPLSMGDSGQADGGTRTPDPIITSDVLYQLSYVGE